MSRLAKIIGSIKKTFIWRGGFSELWLMYIKGYYFPGMKYDKTGIF
jgi:hypothetical protein